MSRVASIVTLMVLLHLAVVAPCLAGSSAADVAADAYEVRERYCAAVGADDVQAAAESLARVSETWAQVSEALAESKKLYLLYWRGMLAQCLGQNEKAQADLTEFTAFAKDRGEYLDLLRDARRRLTFLEGGSGKGRGDVGAPFGVGAGLAGGAAALAGLSGWRASVMRAKEAEYFSGELQTGSFGAVAEEANEAETSSNVLLGSAVGLGVAGVVAIAVGAVRAKRAGGAAASPAVTPIFAVSGPGDGVWLGLGGAW